MRRASPDAPDRVRLGNTRMAFGAMRLAGPGIWGPPGGPGPPDSAGPGAVELGVDHIDNAIQKNDALYGHNRYALFAFGGDKHRTDQAISFPSGSKPRFHSDFSESTELNDRYMPIRGDGTVSILAQTPPEWSSTGQPLWLDSRHADLMNANKAIEQLQRICDDVPLAQALSSEYPVGVELPDVAVAGEPFEIWATNAEATMRLRVRRLTENGTCVWDEEMRPCGDGTFRAEARAEAGRWTLEVYSATVSYVCRDVILVV
ncbi:hypothetical protein OHB49_41875 [Streptomyces sp. NBC_01717]|uniref:hypothetical protein n=1 Tax=Streptomyces sp. NBC_01717 TaxID=2975918 RepID=UPI002E381D28|nr:hypothetical protein [Streptomyces sp. NBC_01717]